jgi:mutator protein MutT
METPETTRVVAAVIEREGRLLLCRRPAGKRHAGLWELPGGKFLPGESPLDAARRELAEELGVEALAIGDRLLAVADPGSPFVVEFYRVEIHGEPAALEHAALAWAAPEELAGYDLAPSDRAFAEDLLRRGV